MASGFDSAILPWTGGLSGEPVAEPGFDSAILAWVGGLGLERAVSAELPLHFWLGGFHIASTPVIPPDGGGGGGGGGGLGWSRPAIRIHTDRRGHSIRRDDEELLELIVLISRLL